MSAQLSPVDPEIMPAPNTVASGAIISADGLYRYGLWRTWDSSLWGVNWVLLNPSTADAHTDDPTVRRCVNFAKRWNAGGILITNLYALRSTDPFALSRATDPIGPENDQYIEQAASKVGWMVVCGWGASVVDSERISQVLGLLRRHKKAFCLGTTRDGYPRHPLYLAAKTELEPLP